MFITLKAQPRGKKQRNISLEREPWHLGGICFQTFKGVQNLAKLMTDSMQNFYNKFS